MTFPTVVTTSSGAGGSSTSQAVLLPTGIVSGDRCIICLGARDASGVFTWPADWTEIPGGEGVNGLTLGNGYRDCDGSEGTTITVTLAGASKAAWTAYRISGHDPGTAPQQGTFATGSSATPNPPNVTAAWGSDDNLFLAVFAGSHIGDSIVAPTNYTNLLHADSSSTNVISTSSAQRQLTAASDDPGTFTGFTSNPWVAQNIVVRPAIVISFGWAPPSAILPGRPPVMIGY